MGYTSKEHFIGRRGMMRAIRYDMPTVGETTGKIWFKGPDTEHAIIMVWGKVQVSQAHQKPILLEAGEIIDWPAGAEYEVKAVEAPVRFVAIFGPNSGLERYERLCPRCKVSQYQLEELHEGVT